jgi:hypothetical protein
MRRGVGLRSVSDVTGVTFSRLGDVRRGKSTRVTLRTERLILNVTANAYAGGARVNGNKTLRLVEKLRREGFTYERLAKQLDLWPETLHRMMKRKGDVIASTEMRVEKFYRALMAESEIAA